MPAPHHVEPCIGEALIYMVKSREGRIEPLAGIVGKAGSVAHNEAVFASSPSAENVDGIVE